MIKIKFYNGCVLIRWNGGTNEPTRRAQLSRLRLPSAKYRTVLLPSKSCSLEARNFSLENCSIVYRERHRVDSVRLFAGDVVVRS